MSATEITGGRGEAEAAVAAAMGGDESAFSALVTRYRRELQLHCYRMLGSLEDSEDMVQETFLRAWGKRESFEGRSSFRSWLYRIATNACLDAIERRRRRPAEGEQAPAPTAPSQSSFEVAWLQPYPDLLLEGIAAPEERPDAQLLAKETIELTYLVAIQKLPPRQRAVLVLRTVLDWSAKETAELLETSVASVNSALQRARAAMREQLPERRAEWAPGSDPSAAERELLDRYVEASEKADADAFLDLLTEDARFAMPPQPEAFVGAQAIVDSWKQGGFGTEEFRDFRCLLTRANTQPAVACYLRRPGQSEYRPLAIDVLRIEGGRVAEIIAFPSDVFRAFELPATL